MLMPSLNLISFSDFKKAWSMTSGHAAPSSSASGNGPFVLVPGFLVILKEDKHGREGLCPCSIHHFKPRPLLPSVLTESFHAPPSCSTEFISSLNFLLNENNFSIFLLSLGPNYLVPATPPCQPACSHASDNGCLQLQVLCSSRGKGEH